MGKKNGAEIAQENLKNSDDDDDDDDEEEEEEEEREEEGTLVLLALIIPTVGYRLELTGQSKRITPLKIKPTLKTGSLTQTFTECTVEAAGW